MKNTRKNELAVCGIEAVKALAKNHPESIRRFYYDDARTMDFKSLFSSLASRKVPYNKVEDSELEKLSGTVHHQGVVAMIEQPSIPHLTVEIADGWLHRKESALLLDRVGNANNLGAIVRSAAFFGVKNIVIPLDEAQSSVTTSSYRVAQGGMEYVNVYSIRSITKLLTAMKGKMIRFGTDVLGNEEHGISDEVRKNCDYLVLIPFSDDPNATRPIESLNVAQAAAIFLYECRNLSKK